MTEFISANSQEPCQAGSPLPPHPTSEDPSLSATAQKRSENKVERHYLIHLRLILLLRLAHRPPNLGQPGRQV